MEPIESRPIELAYLAGLIDGRLGSIQIGKDDGVEICLISDAPSVGPVLAQIARQFGGSYLSGSRAHVWRIRRGAAYRLLQQVLPFMRGAFRPLAERIIADENYARD